MTSALKTLHEIQKDSSTLDRLHPQKLDRWYKQMFDLPHAIHMQQGCGEMFEQIGIATRALIQVESLLGTLPLEVPDLARRAVGKFSWYIQSPPEHQREWNLKAEVRWTAEEDWLVGVQGVPPLKTNRTRGSLPDAVELAKKLANDYGTSLQPDIELEEGIQ